MIKAALAAMSASMAPGRVQPTTRRIWESVRIADLSFNQWGVSTAGAKPGSPSSGGFSDE
jgi:hypothetical protein